eukprot:scaffold303547_cov36-Tisochrysis_lutea.AAC.1
MTNTRGARLPSLTLLHADLDSSTTTRRHGGERDWLSHPQKVTSKLASASASASALSLLSSFGSSKLRARHKRKPWGWHI